MNEEIKEGSARLYVYDAQGHWVYLGVSAKASSRPDFNWIIGRAVEIFMKHRATRNPHFGEPVRIVLKTREGDTEIPFPKD